MDTYNHCWLSNLDVDHRKAIIELYNLSINDNAILGYKNSIDDIGAQKILTDIQNNIRDKSQYICFFYKKNKIVGMVMLKPSSLPNCAHTVEVVKAVIHPDYRGIGIIKILMQQVALKVQLLGKELLVIDVRENSKAHKLWSHYGFIEYGRLPDYVRLNGVAHAGIYMYQYANDLLNRLEKRHDNKINQSLIISR